MRLLVSALTCKELRSCPHCKKKAEQTEND